MGAYLDHKFPRGFLLTEESLVKIRDIITTRIPSISSAMITYKVFRSDGLVVEYDSPNSFVSDNRLRNSNLTEISVHIDQSDLKLVLIFSKANGASMNMETPGRDQAFLLSSDIKEYLSSEVLPHRNIRLDRLGSGFSGIALVAGIFSIFVTTAFRPRGMKIEQALLTRDPLIKLDFLIQNSSAATTDIMYMAIFLPIVVFIILLILRMTAQYLYPKNVFYFGREKDAFDSIRNLRDKIVWGVLVALAVGIFGTWVTGWWGLS